MVFQIDISFDNRVYFTFFSRSYSPLIMWLLAASSSWFILCLQDLQTSLSGQGVTSHLYSLIPSTSAASARGALCKMINFQVLQPQVRKDKLKWLKILSQESRSVPTVHGTKTNYSDQCFLTMLGFSSACLAPHTHSLCSEMLSLAASPNLCGGLA